MPSWLNQAVYNNLREQLRRHMLRDEATKRGYAEQEAEKAAYLNKDTVDPLCDQGTVGASNFIKRETALARLKNDQQQLIRDLNKLGKIIEYIEARPNLQNQLEDLGDLNNGRFYY